MSSSSMTPHRATATATASSHAVPATPSNPNDNEEGIMVAIRMRPLNSKESSSGGSSKPARVWRVLQKYNSVTQTTTDNKPLPERIHGRSFFTYDRTFGEKSTTKEVYEDVAKGIVQSVSNGLNGTIFAYGQTSSGKTYTMQGSGSLQEGATLGQDVTENGGIVHMAAQDIFNHIEKDPERDFLVRVSFIEIYNEEVRDLLVSSGDNRGTLTIREDPRRGVFVNSNETIVTGLDSLLSVLFAGEKNRSVAATGMNERSSRSHTIFRITVESRRKRTRRDDEEDEDDDGDGSDFETDGDARMSLSNDDGAVRVSTLNLVDLAGSESVRHTGATGDRQKEGGKINQSLLTLSRVISNLGEKNKHINFRDSKLTRILQPSLSGNARMAVICCATPSELYLEETRSTLQFASRAKLVKTRAQVNEVMDERSLIKKLQRELKEARRNAANGGGQVDTQKMKECEEEAARDRNARRKAEQDLQRLKESILKGGVLGKLNRGAHEQSKKTSLYKSLFVYNDDDETIRAGDTETPDNFSLRISKKRKTKRRFSDGVIHEQSKSTMKGAGLGSPLRDVSNAVRNQANKFHDANADDFTSPSKSGTITKMQAHTELKPKKKKPISTHNIIMSSEMSNVDIGLLRDALAAKSAQTAGLKADLNEAREQLRLAQKEISNEHGEKEMLRMAKRELESQVSALASDKEFAVTEQDFILAEKEDIIAKSLRKIELTLEDHKKMQLEFKTLKKERETEISELNCKNEQLQAENDQNSQLIHSLQAEISTINEERKRYSTMLEAQSQESLTTASRLQQENQKLKEEITSQREKYELSLEELRASLEEASQHAVSAAISSSQEEIDSLKQQLFDQALEHKNIVNELQNALDHSNSTNTESSEKLAAASAEIELMTTTNTDLTKRIKELEVSTAESAMKLAETTASLDNLNSSNSELSQRVSSLEEDKAGLEKTNASIVDELTLKNSLIEKLQSKLDSTDAELLSLKTASATQVDSLNQKISDLSTTLKEKDNELVTLIATANALRHDASSSDEQIKALTDKNEKLSYERDLEKDRADQLAQTSSENESSLCQKLADANQSLQQSSAEVAQLRETMESLEATKNSVSAELQVANEKIVALEEKLTNNESYTKELLESAECLEKKVSDSTETNSKLELKLSEANIAISALQSKASSDANELKSLTEEIANVRYQNERLEERANQLESSLSDSSQQSSTEIARLQEIMKTLEADKSLLSEELELVNEKIVALEDVLAEKESKIVTLGESEENLKKALSEKTAQFEESTETNSKLESALSEANHKITTLQSEVSSAAEKIKFLSEDIANCRSENVRLVECANQLESSFTDSSKQLSIEVTHLQEKVNALEVSKSALSDELQLAKEKIIELEEKLTDKQSMEIELEELKKSLEREVSESLTQIERLSDSNSNLESTLNSKDVEITEAKATISSLLSDASIAADEIKTLSDELATLHCENERLAEHAKTLQSSLSEREFNLTQNLTEVNKLLEDSRNEVIRLSGLVDTLESSLHAEKHVSAELEQFVEETEKDVLRLTNDNNSADLEIQELTAKLDKVTAERDDAAAKLIEAHKSLLNTSNENVAMNDQVAELKNMESEYTNSIAKLEATIQERDDEIITLNKSIESSLARIESTEKALSGLSAEKEELTSKLESIDVQLYTAQNEKLSAITSISELESRIEEITVERDHANAQVSELLSGSNSSANIVSSLQSDKDELEESVREYKADVSRLKTENEDLNKVTARLEKSVEEMKLKTESYSCQLDAANAQIDAMVIEKDETTSKMKKLESEYQECLTELELALEAKEKFVAESSMNIEQQKMELDECRRKKREQADEIKRLNNNIRSLHDDIEELKNQLKSKSNDLSSEISALKFELEESKSRCAILEEEKQNCFRESEVSLMKAESLNSDKLAKREEMIETLVKETEVLKQDIKRLTEDLELKSAEKYRLESKIESAEVELSHLREESQKANANAADLQSMVESLAVERDLVQRCIMDSSSGSDDSQNSFAILQTEKSNLEVELKQLTESLANEKAHFKCIIEGLENEKNNLTSKLCDSNSTMIDLTSKLEIVTAKHDSLVEDNQKHRRDIESFANEKAKLVNDFTMKEANYQRNISELEDTLKEKTHEISQLSNRVSSLETSENSISIQSSADIESLKEEIQELTRLLASANASVEEARGAALESDEALVAKELELSKALEEIDDLEYALRVAEDKIRNSSNAAHCDSHPSDTHEELLRDMEALMKEKVDAEARLEEELLRRKDFENEVKKAAEEENEKLMMEADETIRLLKEKNSQLTEDLSSAESEVYTLKQESEDLLDRMSRAEAKASDLESVIASMKDELYREKENKKKLVEDLNKLEQDSANFKAQVIAAKESFQSESQSKIETLEAKLQNAMIELSKTQKELTASEQTIANLTSDIDEYKKELDSANEFASNAARMEISELKVSIATLKGQLAAAQKECLVATKEKEHEKRNLKKLADKSQKCILQLKTQLDEAKAALKIDGGTQVKLDTLESKVTELTELNREKDERIGYLEKHKITKQLLETFKQLKVDKSRFEREVMVYKDRVEELEQQLTSTQSRQQGLRERKDPSHDGNSEEVDKLKDDLQQSNIKLRKYVKHCDLLKREKESIEDAISSYSIDELKGCSLAEKVASLCEKLKSTEEECDALAKSEEKASEYLSNLDSLRKKYEELQAQLEREKEYKVNLVRAEKRIASLLKEQESLRTLADSAKSSASDLHNAQSRQIEFLQNENLQLIEELKSTRKALTETKERLNDVHREDFNEATEDLQGLNELFSSSFEKKIDPVNTQKQHITESNEAMYCNDDEKENLENRIVAEPKMKSPTPSEKKKRKNPNPFSGLSSIKKTARRKPRLDGTPKKFALGESEMTEEATTECNQS